MPSSGVCFVHLFSVEEYPEPSVCRPEAIASSRAAARELFKTAWRLTQDRAKIDGLHFHDLRREAGSRWMDTGVPLATIQRWLGHAASLGGDERAIMRAFEERIGRLASPPQGLPSIVEDSQNFGVVNADNTDSATIH